MNYEFKECPHCHRPPMVVGSREVKVEGNKYIEWLCGNCLTPVGILPMTAVKAAIDPVVCWNILVGGVH
jgi:hypothetical protein